MPSWTPCIDAPGQARQVLHMTVTPKRGGAIVADPVESKQEAKRIVAGLFGVSIDQVKLAEASPAPARRLA